MLLFTVLPEQNDIEDDPYVSLHRGNMTAWFPVLGLVMGFFAYGLIISVVELLQFSGITDMTTYVLSIIPISGLAAMAPTFACWLGQPREGDELAEQITGAPTASGICLLVIVTVACYLFLLVVFPPMLAAAVLAVGLLVSLAVPHVMSHFSGGVTEAMLPVSNMVSGVISLVLLSVCVVLL